MKSFIVAAALVAALVAGACNAQSAAASTNSTLVTATVRRVYMITGYNAAASLRYIKLYNKATAPTCGTDTPLVVEAVAPGARFSITYADIGVSFSSGVGYCLTTGVADNDTGALTAGDISPMSIYTN